jgi:hypothetical protein
MKSFLDLSEIDDRVFRESVKIEREHPNLIRAEKQEQRFPKKACCSLAISAGVSP